MYSDVYSRKQSGPPPSTASCYICLEDGTDSELLRNCACRGDAGWAHVACLAKYLDCKATEAMRTHDESIDFVTLWTNCILCKTPYMQNMGLAMAKACVKNYECLPDTNKVRMFSLHYMATINVQLGNHNDALKLYNRLLEILKIATGQGLDVRSSEIRVLEGMILVYMEMNRCNVAIALIERHIEIGIDLEGPNSSLVQDKRQMLTMLHSVIGEESDYKKDTAAELVWARQKFKEVQEDGNTMESRLSHHIVVVNALNDDGKTEEAMEQFEKMLSESRQVLGPNHPATLRYENSFNNYYTGKQEAGEAEIQKKNIWAVIDYEKKPAIHGQRVKVLKATKKDAGIYICQFKNRNVSTKVKVVHDQFILDAGTAVVVHGLVASKVLNGSSEIIQSFDKGKCRYVVSVGTKKKAPVLIKSINLDIVFA